MYLSGSFIDHSGAERKPEAEGNPSAAAGAGGGGSGEGGRPRGKAIRFEKASSNALLSKLCPKEARLALPEPEVRTAPSTFVH